MKFIAEIILKHLTKIYLKRNRPKIVAITGSNGKTSAKETVFAVLKNKYKVRKSEKNYNTEIGVPLSVFGIEAPKNKFGWTAVLLKSIKEAYFAKSAPEILILEMGADKPGDIKYLIGFIKPDIAIVTAIGDFPVHVAAYGGPKAVAEEKSNLVKSLETNGVAILNFDDRMVLEMKEKTKGHVFTFGFEDRADIKAIEMQNNFGDFFGISFKIESDGKVVPMKLENIYGKPAVYAALAAIAVGKVMDMNLIEIADALKDYKAPKGRLNLIKGINQSHLLDDTYNSSPLATAAALEVLKELSAKRKFAVLGDMKELGKYSEEAHAAIGKEAAKIADYIFTVGEQAEFIAQGAIESGFKKENIFKFKNSIEAGKALYDMVSEEDLILIKGSQSMRMELAAEEIMAEPEKKKDLLVRQDWPWKDYKGNPRLP